MIAVYQYPIVLILPTAICLLFSGCLNFGPEISTTTPSAEHVARCRAEMRIEPDLEIQSLGFKLDGSGIDDAIWFKFIAKTDKIADVFKKSAVDSTKFAPAFKVDYDAMPSWWDASTKLLIGGQIELPNARFMNVGYVANKDGTLTVYIMWHET